MKRLYKQAENYINNSYDFIRDWMWDNYKDEIINKLKEIYNKGELINKLNEYIDICINEENIYDYEGILNYINQIYSDWDGKVCLLYPNLDANVPSEDDDLSDITKYYSKKLKRENFNFKIDDIENEKTVYYDYVRWPIIDIAVDVADMEVKKLIKQLLSEKTKNYMNNIIDNGIDYSKLGTNRILKRMYKDARKYKF